MNVRRVARLIAASPRGDKAKKEPEMIEVSRLPGDDPMKFEVRARDGAGQTRHRVTMKARDFARLAPSATPERCVEAAFAFLLDREPKESILASFDVSVISRYFSDFESKFPNYLAER